MKWSWRLTSVVAANVIVAAACAAALSAVHARFSGSQLQALLLSEFGVIDVVLSVIVGYWATWIEREALRRTPGTKGVLTALSVPGLGLLLIAWHLARATAGAVASEGYYLYSSAGNQLLMAAMALMFAGVALAAWFFFERAQRSRGADALPGGNAV